MHTLKYLYLKHFKKQSFTSHKSPELLTKAEKALFNRKLMASIHHFLSALSILSILVFSANAQLSTTFYATSCPRLAIIVRNAMRQAIVREARMGASILRLFFHDCFVNGCDASILLDDTATFTGEKNAFPNRNSARGFEVIDTIKAQVEVACNATVSCADILALAARDGVVLLGGPSWTVPLGRRDATTASQSAANSQIPSPFSSLATLISMFSAKGLSARDMTVLSGAHTIGLAQCRTFRSRIYNDSNIDARFAATRQANCPASGGDTNLAPIDGQTPSRFDNAYYQDLTGRRGLFHSDQELFNNGTQDQLVRTYSFNNAAFFRDFAAAMVRLGSISPLTGTSGEIRRNCRVVN
ncbi:hem peroxidase [Dillenia turbinata]|uniref:Peroxidase n=1 Tax=Dillenia turbinata TaxID=194707 RepID=A0AAN8Z094_9MAGN